MKIIRTKIFEDEDATVIERKLNVFLDNITPKDIVDIKSIGKSGFYGFLVIYYVDK